MEVKCEIGSIVMLNSGSPFMTVTEVVSFNEQLNALCTYITKNGEVTTITIPCDCLMLMTPSFIETLIDTFIDFYYK